MTNLHLAAARNQPAVPVTVVIATLNEADRLPRCLAALGWAAEVIVADAGSTDGTVTLARRWGAQVLSCAGMSIGAQRNRAIEAAGSEWILAVDADEVASPELARSIAKVLESPEFDAYRVPFRNRYLGRDVERGSWAFERRVRFFRRSLRFSGHHVHEKVVYAGPVGDVCGWLSHDSYRDLAHHMEKANRYATLGAADLWRQGRRASLLGDLVLRPTWRFIRFYLLDGGWRDGRRGLVFSAVAAWSGFAKYASLWYLEEAAVHAAERQAAAREPAPVTGVEADRAAAIAS